MDKIDEITNIIDYNEVDIVCATETWLSDEVPHVLLKLMGTRVRGGTELIGEGGVLTYIHNSIPYNRLSILECDEVEALWLW